jgi:hypothetical protein
MCSTLEGPPGNTREEGHTWRPSPRLILRSFRIPSILGGRTDKKWKNIFNLMRISPSETAKKSSVLRNIVLVMDFLQPHVLALIACSKGELKKGAKIVDEIFASEEPENLRSTEKKSQVPQSIETEEIQCSVGFFKLFPDIFPCQAHMGPVFTRTYFFTPRPDSGIS